MHRIGRVAGKASVPLLRIRTTEAHRLPRTEHVSMHEEPCCDARAHVTAREASTRSRHAGSTTASPDTPAPWNGSADTSVWESALPAPTPLGLPRSFAPPARFHVSLLLYVYLSLFFILGLIHWLCLSLSRKKEREKRSRWWKSLHRASQELSNTRIPSDQEGHKNQIQFSLGGKTSLKHHPPKARIPERQTRPKH